MGKGFSTIILVVLLGMLSLNVLLVFTKSKATLKPKPAENKVDIFYEKIPGSKFHSPDATWWGYNQSKIVRFQNLVFIYVIENLDDSNKTASDFVIYKKDGKSKWEKGASFPTSRPGNILIDSTGTLHAFVFVPTDIAKNDSIGKLMHYSFPNSQSGDITKYQAETVVEAKDNVETVNIRFGAAIAKDDTMAIGFGLTTFNPLYHGHSQHLYFKKTKEPNWRHLIAGENLGHDFYYPFVAANSESFHLLSVQDDFANDGDPKTYDNIYQKIIYFGYEKDTWRNQMIADLSSHPLASKRARLLEQESLLVEENEQIHIIYKEFLDPETDWKANHKHVTFSNGQKQETDLNLGKDINWIRLVEVDKQLYYLVTTWNEIYLGKVGSQNLHKLDTPQDVKAIYPYVYTSSDVVDVLLLGADSKEYGSTSHYYLKIPNSLFAEVK